MTHQYQEGGVSMPTFPKDKNSCVSACPSPGTKVIDGWTGKPLGELMDYGPHILTREPQPGEKCPVCGHELKPIKKAG